MPSAAKSSTAKHTAVATKALADFQDVIEEVIAEDQPEDQPEDQQEDQQEEAEDADDEEEMSHDGNGEVVKDKKRKRATTNARPRGRKTLERDEDDACIRRNIAHYKADASEYRSQNMEKIPAILKAMSDAITVMRPLNADDKEAMEQVYISLTADVMK